MTKKPKFSERPFVPFDVWYPELVYYDKQHDMQYTAMPAGNYPGKFFFDVQVSDREGGWCEEYHSGPDYDDINAARNAALEWRETYLEGRANDQANTDQ